MPYPTIHHRIQVFRNNRGAPGGNYGREHRAILNEEEAHAAQSEIASWHGYAPTALVPLPGLAAAAGVGAIH